VPAILATAYGDPTLLPDNDVQKTELGIEKLEEEALCGQCKQYQTLKNHPSSILAQWITKIAIIPINLFHYNSH
jgi:hypothetical protein